MMRGICRGGERKVEEDELTEEGEKYVESREEKEGKVFHVQTP